MKILQRKNSGSVILKEEWIHNSDITKKTLFSHIPKFFFWLFFSWINFLFILDIGIEIAKVMDKMLNQQVEECT